MKIHWSDEAARAIDEIIVEVVTRSGKAAAKKLVEKMAAHIAHLEQHPEMGRMVPELDKIEVLAVTRPRRPLPRLTLPPVDD